MRDLAAHEFVEAGGHAAERRFGDMQYAPGFSGHRVSDTCGWTGLKGKAGGGCPGPRHGLPVREAAQDAQQPGHRPPEARSRGRGAPGLGGGCLRSSRGPVPGISVAVKEFPPGKSHPASNHAGRNRPTPSSLSPEGLS